MSGVMSGFQKGKTLSGKTSGHFHIVKLQNWVTKKFEKYLHLSSHLGGTDPKIFEKTQPSSYHGDFL